MGWAVGEFQGRDIGYGVPAICDHPGCGEEINRGLGYVCGDDVYGGDHGCGLFFCVKHKQAAGKRREHKSLCSRCYARKPPFDPTPDTLEWICWKLADESWGQWRAENPEKVNAMEMLVPHSTPSTNRPALPGEQDRIMTDWPKSKFPDLSPLE